MDYLPLLKTKERLLVRVKPKSKKSEILNYDEETNTFLIAVKAPPEDGKANAELERYLSKLLKQPVRIKSGHTSKTKTLIIG